MPVYVVLEWSIEVAESPTCMSSSHLHEQYYVLEYAYVLKCVCPHKSNSAHEGQQAARSCAYYG